jgi:site-specific DNA-methyltransferase (adenine-specific)
MNTVQCLCADARDPSAYEQLLAGTSGPSVQLLLTDPPYCLLTRRRKHGDLRDPHARARKLDHERVVRFENVREYREFTQAWLPLALNRLAPGAFAIIWTNLLGKEPIVQVAASHGFAHLHGEFIWGKRTREVNNANEQLLRVYEVALVFARTPAAPLGPDDLPKPWSVVAGYDDDGEAARFGSHPHHKPFSVLEPLVRCYSRQNDRVLDPFAGSGSIPAAAQRLGRVPLCMELAPEWAERVTRRLRGET